MVSVAVIGAGLSGLSCARELVKAGHEVVVFEKSRGVGGRAPTRWIDRESDPPLGFDHGTQYFHAESALFKSTVLEAQKAGAVAPWVGRVVDLAYGVATEHSVDSARWVGAPGMASFSKFLSTGLNVQAETRVVQLRQVAQKWQVVVQKNENPETEWDTSFDWVICAAPAEQAAQLLAAVAPEASAKAASVQSSVTWSAMLTFNQSLPVPYDAAFVVDSPLGWISRDSSKPGRAQGERWVLHATADWSDAHVNEPREAIVDRLVDVFHSVVGLYEQPEIAKAHRWLYSIPTNPLSAGAWVDPSMHLGVCGDWLGKGNVESAFDSGFELAQTLKAAL